MTSNQQISEPAVLHLFGLMGTGKTYLLETFSRANPNSVQILTPSMRGEIFTPVLADFDNYKAVALDEVLMWDRDSLVAGVAALELKAIENGKKLILVTQKREDVVSAGIQLKIKPLAIQLHG